MSLPDGKWFKASEFACKDGEQYPAVFAERWTKLVTLCDRIREAWGGQLIVVSGYRSPTYNEKLIEDDAKKGAHGVASGSKHITGEAADLRTRYGRNDVAQLYRVIMNLWTDGHIPLLGGIGVYPVSGWVHVDIAKAEDGHLRRWTGT